MKNIFFLFCFLGCFNLQAQDLVKILDSETEKPIPYATVVLKNGDDIIFGNNTDEQGKIEIDKRLAFDFVEISCVGFENKIIEKCFFDSDVVLLEKKTEDLTEVFLSDLPKEQKVIGYINEKRHGYSGVSEGAKIAVFLGNSLKKEVMIQSVLFKLKKVKNETAFRMLFYKKTKSGLPEELLLEENIIVSLQPKTKGLYEVDVSQYNLKLPVEGVFIAIEAVGEPSFKFEFHRSQEPIYFFNNEHENGQRTGWFSLKEWSMRYFSEKAVLKRLTAPSIGLKVSEL